MAVRRRERGKNMGLARYGRSYNRAEALLLGEIFSALMRGGEVGALMRSGLAKKMATGFIAMAMTARLAPQRSERKPKPKSERKAKADPEARREAQRQRSRDWRAKQRAIRESERASKGEVRLTAADCFRPTPYVFSEWELSTMCGLRGIFSDSEIAAHFGASAGSMRDALKRWRSNVKVAVDPCVA
jgi:hypothetical protein